jgi:hypothetical protein
MATMPITATITIEEEAETPSQEAEVADLQVLITKTSIQALLHHSLNTNPSNLSLLLKRSQKGLLAKSVGSKVIMPLTVTTEWTLLTKAKMHQQN